MSRYYLKVILYARIHNIIHVLISSKHQTIKSGEFKLAMQYLITLVHIQMQQMVHELAPPICVLKFTKFSPFLFLSPFLILSLFLSRFVINDHKGSNFSEN